MNKILIFLLSVPLTTFATVTPKEAHQEHQIMIKNACKYHSRHYIFANNPKRQKIGLQHFQFHKYPMVNMVFNLKQPLTNESFIHMNHVGLPLRIGVYDKNYQKIATTTLPVQTNLQYILPIGTQYILEIPIYNPFNTLQPPNSIKPLLNSCF